MEVLKPQSQKKREKRTFTLKIKRKDTRKGEPFLSCDLLNNDTIVLRFQCDEETTPTVSELMEMFD